MSSTDRSDGRYNIEFSSDEPGVLENVVTFGAATVIKTAADAVLGEGHGWYCKITDSVTDQWESRWGATKGEAQEAAFRALKVKIEGFVEDQERERARERQLYEQTQHASAESENGSSTGEDSGVGCIIKLVLGLVAVAAVVWIVLAIVWVVVAVAIPLLVFDLATLALIAGLLRKHASKFLLPLSVAGAVYAVADFYQGWLTRIFTSNVPALAGVIPVLFYVNILAGLIASYFLIQTFMDKRNPPPQDAGEFTRRNLIAMGCLLLVGVLTVGIQVMVDSQRKHAVAVISEISTSKGTFPIVALPIRSRSDAVNSIMVKDIFGRSYSTSDIKSMIEIEGWDKNNYANFTSIGYQVKSNTNSQLILDISSCVLGVRENCATREFTIDPITGKVTTSSL